MKFEERLSELINEVEVPDELSPQNIAAMLKDRSGQAVGQTNRHTKTETEHGHIRVTTSAAARKRGIIVRTSAAVAACAVFAAGMVAYSGANRQEPLGEPIVYEATSPGSIDDLYNIYTGITLDGGGEYDSEKTIDETENPESSEYAGTDISDAEAVQKDENYLYLLKNGKVYIVSLETMETVSEIECSLGPPVTMYLEGNKLILISGEKEEIYYVGYGNAKAADSSPEAADPVYAPDVPANGADTKQAADNGFDILNEAMTNDKTGGENSEGGKSAIPANAALRENAVVEIYDVSSAENPVRTTTYKQNGKYVSSTIAEGVLYTVTDYSDYRVKPLDTQADLDSFVPAFYFNGEKNYIAPTDIIIPSTAANTNYTVASAIKLEGEPKAAVKAVLGSGRNVYCSADTLYTAAAAKKDDKEYTVITSFALSEEGISYRASGSVDGALLGRRSMDEYDGLFRIAAITTDENGAAALSVYALDRTLTVVNSAGRLIPDGQASYVRFEQNYARIMDRESRVTALALDLSTTPPTLCQSLEGTEGYIHRFGDKFITVGRSGENGLDLKAYSGTTGLEIGSLPIETDNVKLYSKAITDRRAMLVDEKSGIIGVPVYSYNEFGTENSYCIFGCDESGLTLKGTIGYVDVDDSALFRRGYVSGDTLYVIGGGYIVAVRVGDLKVIGTYEY